MVPAEQLQGMFPALAAPSGLDALAPAPAGVPAPAPPQAAPVAVPTPAPPSAPAAPAAAPARIPQAGTKPLSDRQAQLEKRRDELQDQLLQLQESGALRDIALAKAQRDAEAQDEKDLADLRAKYAVAVPDLPQWEPRPVVSPEEFQSFSMLLLGMALIGGAKGDWMGASSALNGAMRGYIAGNQTSLDDQWQQYQANYKRALDKQRKAQTDMEDALYAKQHSISERLRDTELQAKIHEREDVVRAAGIQRSLDSADRQLTSTAQSMERAETSNAQIEAKMQIARDHLAQSQHSADLTPEAQEVASRVENITGKTDFTSQLYRRFGRAEAVKTFNDRVYFWLQEHPGQGPKDMADDLVRNNTLYKGLQRAFAVNQVREAGVYRLTAAIQTMEQTITELAKKVAPSGYPIINVRVNQINTALGDPGIVALRNMILATARLYIEAVTMPGSNAQIHATAQETADEMINANMSVGQIMGAFYAMNREINATQGALSSISQHLLQRIGHQYGTSDIQPEIRERMGVSAERDAKALDWNAP